MMPLFVLNYLIKIKDEADRRAEILLARVGLADKIDEWPEAARGHSLGVSNEPGRFINFLREQYADGLFYYFAVVKLGPVVFTASSNQTSNGDYISLV